jgi:hypothetical protein
MLAVRMLAVRMLAVRTCGSVCGLGGLRRAEFRDL